MSVKPLFVDTAYIYALFNKRDKWHEKAIEWQQKIALENRRLLTTQFILTEIGDGLSPLKSRQNAATYGDRCRRYGFGGKTRFLCSRQIGGLT